MLPHLLLKIPRLQVLPQFYTRARLPCPRALALIGFTVESVIVASLLCNVEVRYGAAIGVAFLIVAAFATIRINGSAAWRWDRGGPEYPIYLAVILTMLAFYANP